jgi:hypothetical protein
LRRVMLHRSFNNYEESIADQDNDEWRDKNKYLESSSGGCLEVRRSRAKAIRQGRNYWEHLLILRCCSSYCCLNQRFTLL